MFPWCGCHGNIRCLATPHCTFSSYGRPEAERVNQFGWNLVRHSKLRPQWQSLDQILKFLKFKMADGRHIGKYSKCHNRMWRNLGGHIPSCSRHVRHDAVAMAMAVAKQRRIVRRTLEHNLRVKYQPNVAVNFLNSIVIRLTACAVIVAFSYCILILLALLLCSFFALSFIFYFSYRSRWIKLCIEHSAVMGAWRPNA